jgi:hypothetical protein
MKESLQKSGGYQHAVDETFEYKRQGASVLVAYARAAYRLNKEGQAGAKTVFDVAPGYLSPRSAEDLRRDLL